MVSRVRMWFAFVAAMLGRLSAPRPDIAASDAELEQLLRTSSLGRAVDRVTSWAAPVWSDAATKHQWSRVQRIWIELTAAQRIRAVAVATMAMSITALLGLAIRSFGPLSWMMPAALVLCGLMVWMASAPLARALSDRRS